MPGRGQPWKLGKGVQDRIGSGEVEDDSLLSEDIKDGTIQEVDLDSALQAKLNAADDSGYDEVKDEGTPLTKRSKLNFIGTGVNAVDNGDTTDVTITQATPDGVGYDEVKEEGTPLTKRSKLNFIGTGVTASDNGDTTDVTITQSTPDGVGYDEIQEEGTPLAKEPAIDFQGAGVTATAGTGKTIVTIPGGGGGGGLTTIADVTVTTPTFAINVPFTTIDLVSGNVWKIIVDFYLNRSANSGLDAIGVTIDNNTSANLYLTNGHFSIAGSVLGTSNQDDHWGSDFDFGGATKIHLEFIGQKIPPIQAGGDGFIGSYEYLGNNSLYAHGNFSINRSILDVTTISSIQFFAPASTDTISTGSRVIIKTEGF